VGTATAFLVGIPAVLATLHAADSQFRWWWPTDWMAVPSVIFFAGCLLVAIPVRQSPDNGVVGTASLTRPAVPLPGGDRAGAEVRPGQVVVGEIPREPAAFVARVMVSRLAAAAGGGRVAVVCAVTGLRGVGKTQVAAAYARARVGDGWGLVGWVNAETRDVLLDGLKRVAEGLGVADPMGDSLESARRLGSAHNGTATGDSELNPVALPSAESGTKQEATRRATWVQCPTAAGTPGRRRRLSAVAVPNTGSPAGHVPWIC
jgi:hypothetical protein